MNIGIYDFIVIYFTSEHISIIPQVAATASQIDYLFLELLSMLPL